MIFILTITFLKEITLVFFNLLQHSFRKAQSSPKHLPRSTKLVGNKEKIVW